MRRLHPEQFKDNPSIDPPELTLFDEDYLVAFHRLSSSRQIGMAVGPIPLSEIVMYADRFGFDDIDAAIVILQSMDNAYLTERHKEK